MNNVLQYPAAATDEERAAIFRPLRIAGMQVSNRIWRSSVGGRMSNYDGTVTDVWKNFERRFAMGGAGAIVSTTFHVNRDRLSPLQYPTIADDDPFVPRLRHFIDAIRRDNDCKYIVQIGDPGYAAQSSLFPEREDSMSSSGGVDIAFGYGNVRRRMPHDKIMQAIADFGRAARRVEEAGADGVEITAAKGYLIHQFLNPGLNRRTDAWGGSPENRFRLLEEVVRAVKASVRSDFPIGVRISAADYNYSPPQFALARFPWFQGSGNPFEQTLDYVDRLQDLGVDYFHVVGGYGFPCPHDVPGTFPFEEIRMFFNSVRHLSFKAMARATAMNLLWRPVGHALSQLWWRQPAEVNLEAARIIAARVRMNAHGRPVPAVIANGGFQYADRVANALEDVEVVSMARALIANPELPRVFQGIAHAAPQCEYCNKCVGRTATSPLGCYLPSRFDRDIKRMTRQILDFNRPDRVPAPQSQGSNPVGIRIR